MKHIPPVLAREGQRLLMATLVAALIVVTVGVLALFAVFTLRVLADSPALVPWLGAWLVLMVVLYIVDRLTE